MTGCNAAYDEPYQGTRWVLHPVYIKHMRCSSDCAGAPTAGYTASSDRSLYRCCRVTASFCSRSSRTLGLSRETFPIRRQFPERTMVKALWPPFFGPSRSQSRGSRGEVLALFAAHPPKTLSADKTITNLGRRTVVGEPLDAFELPRSILYCCSKLVPHFRV